MPEEIETQLGEMIQEQPKVGCLGKLKIHKFKIFGGILGVFIFAGAVFGAYKFGQKQIQPGPQPTPTPVVEATPTPDPTANWKTYTNTKYGYSIKYPEDWSVTPLDDPAYNRGVTPSCEESSRTATLGNYDLYDLEKTGLAKGEIEVDVSFFQCAEDLKTWFHPYQKYDSWREITVAGLKAIRAKLNYTQQRNYTYVDIFVKREGRIWEIHSITPTSEEMESLFDTFDLMVSTFKLLE
ncbi:MAG TPA: PsbP-related protein [Nevskiaceae bacterium]|nr:PsbP-related protein [Nevskiaceae bacterium]